MGKGAYRGVVNVLPDGDVVMVGCSWLVDDMMMIIRYVASGFGTVGLLFDGWMLVLRSSSSIDVLRCGFLVLKVFCYVMVMLFLAMLVAEDYLYKWK